MDVRYDDDGSFESGVHYDRIDRFSSDDLCEHQLNLLFPSLLDAHRREASADSSAGVEVQPLWSNSNTSASTSHNTHNYRARETLLQLF